MSASRVFKKLVFDQLQRFQVPVLRVAERLPKTIPLHDIKSLEYEADWIELTPTQNNETT